MTVVNDFPTFLDDLIERPITSFLVVMKQSELPHMCIQSEV
jgi:hypothetical protein